MTQLNNPVISKMTEKKEVSQEPKKEEVLSTTIKVGGNRRTESYVKIAENMFLTNEEISLCGLGNTIRTVVNCCEILKHRKYATPKKIETSMIEGEFSSQPIAKIQIYMQRNPGVKELIEKLQEERNHETEYEKLIRNQEEKDSIRD